LEYQAAIEAAAPGGKSTSDVSAQVKKNCDAVYSAQKAKWGEYIKSGEVTIEKDYKGKTEVVATYTY
jgi:hypothetical protein